jgi:hypothetical protein
MAFFKVIISMLVSFWFWKRQPRHYPLKTNEGFPEVIGGSLGID